MTRRHLPDDPDGQLRRWINRCLKFLDEEFDPVLHAMGPSRLRHADPSEAESAVRRFLSFQRLSDGALANALDVVAGVSTWLDEHPDVGNSNDRETLDYMLTCLMNDRLSVIDRSRLGAASTVWAV